MTSLGGGPAVHPRVAILYEHRPWLEPLLERLGERGLSCDPVPIRRMTFDPGMKRSPHRLVVNRVSAFPGGTGNPRMVFTAREYLRRLESCGAQVLNGYEAYVVATSKLRQLGILADLGLKFPRTRAFQRRRQLPEIADELTLPLIFKPNIGGSGVGIRVFYTEGDLHAAAQDYTFDMGADGIGVLQEYHRPWSDHIVRVEMLDGKLLYGIQQPITPGAFNYCLIDGRNAACDPELMEIVRPPPEVVKAAAQTLQRAGAVFGSVEYLVSGRDGERYYFDINPFSNYVKNRLPGFDPLDRLADFIAGRATHLDARLAIPHV